MQKAFQHYYLSIFMQYECDVLHMNLLTCDIFTWIYFDALLLFIIQCSTMIKLYRSLTSKVYQFIFWVPFYTLTDYVLFVLLDNFLVHTWVWCWMAWLRKFLYWIASWTQGSSCGYWSIKVHLCRKYLHDNQHWSS